MQNYKDSTGDVHFLSDTDILNGGEALLPEGCIEITQAEADAIILSQIPGVVPVTPEDPVTKLKNFLAANPDVDALLK